MAAILKILIVPCETDFGIARLVELSDGSGRVEVFDEASKSWGPSPKGLTLGEISAGKPVSAALAARLGLSESYDDALKEEIDRALSDLAAWGKRYIWLSRFDQNQGYSPKGLKQRDQMIANGYDPRTITPSSLDGSPVYDPELDQELKGIYGRLNEKAAELPESPSEEEARVAIEKARRPQEKAPDVQNWLLNAIALNVARRKEEFAEFRATGAAWMLECRDLWDGEDEDAGVYFVSHKSATEVSDYLNRMNEDSDRVLGIYSLARPLEEQGPGLKAAQWFAGGDHGSVDPNHYGMTSLPWIGVKLATVRALQRQPLRVQQIADRWASGSRTQVRALEAKGQLLERLKEQAALEGKVLADARMCGAFSDVPDHEILAMNEIEALP
jgi:hypothetical protein